MLPRYPIGRWGNELKRRLRSPEFIISLVLLVVLSYLILVPLFNLAWRTFSWGPGDARISSDAVPGEFTTAHWERLLMGRVANKMVWQPLAHTMVTGTIAALLALFLGGILAWFVVRSDLPGRKWMRTLLTLPYLVPAFAIAMAWETMFKSPLVGGRPGFFQVLFGVPPPTWLSYGPIPIIIAMTIHFYPFAFILVAAALSSVDSQLEESAELQGASRWTIIRRITFPMVLPAFLSALVLIFGRTIGGFAIPYFLGGPVRYWTLSTMLFRNFSLGLDVNGYVLAILLIALASLIVYFNTRVLGGSTRKFEIIGGKGFKSNLAPLGRWRWPIFGAITAFTIAVAIFPIGLLLYQSLMLIDGQYGLNNLTLHYWIGRSDPSIAFGLPGLFRNSQVLGGAWNSIRFAVTASAISAFLGLIIGYIVVRRGKSWLSKLLNQISFFPYLFPGIAFGAMYLSMFAVRRGPIPALYGTFTLIVLVAVVKRLPYTTRTGTSAITQINQELEEAAQLQGSSWLHRFRRIVIPLATSGIVSGMMVTFVGLMRVLAPIILLITPSTRVLMTVAYRFAEDDITQLSNALILLVTFITIIGEVLIWRLGRGKLSRMREGAP
ncbi:iron ABC transporter permease [Candidatus Acetothermia bacterium]|nr:MAG: iron ABC transporter permease [Candidatus Acetothermia bacterium]